MEHTQTERLLLADDRGFHRLVHFEPDEALEVVAGGVAAGHYLAVLDDALEAVEVTPV